MLMEKKSISLNLIIKMFQFCLGSISNKFDDVEAWMCMMFQLIMMPLINEIY